MFIYIYLVVFFLVSPVLINNVYAHETVENDLKAIAGILQKTETISGNYEIRRRHLEPFEEIREEGVFRLMRPNYLSMNGWNLMYSKKSDKWQQISAATGYFSNGRDFYTIFTKQKGVSFQKTAAESSGKNVPVKLEPLADFFDGNNSFYRQIAEARRQNMLTSLDYKEDITWENSSYKVIEFITDSTAKGVSTHQTTQIFIGGDRRIHRLIVTKKFGELITETETILRNVSTQNELKSADFSYDLPAAATPYVPPPSPLAEGTQAPDITFEDSAGKLVKLSDYQGKTVILDFWATWCLPCIKSFPHTAQAIEKFDNKDVVVLAVNIWDSKENALNWVAKRTDPFPFTFVNDIAGAEKKDSVTLFQVNALPLLYVISPKGKVVAVFEGYRGPTTELEEILKAAKDL